MNDQTIKADAGKLRISLVPTGIIKDIAEVRMYGVQKYGASESWKSVETERYKDAMLRHLLAWLDDPDGLDAESGIEHWKHFCCNVAFISELRCRNGCCETDKRSKNGRRKCLLARIFKRRERSEIKKAENVQR